MPWIMDMERKPLNCDKLPWSPNIYTYIHSANNEHKFHGIHELYNLEIVNMFCTCMIRSGGDSCSCPWTQQGSKAAVSKYRIPGKLYADNNEFDWLSRRRYLCRKIMTDVTFACYTDGRKAAKSFSPGSWEPFVELQSSLIVHCIFLYYFLNLKIFKKYYYLVF